MTIQQLIELQNLIVGSAATVLLLCLPFLGRWATRQIFAVLARNHLVEFARVAVLAAEFSEINAP